MSDERVVWGPPGTGKTTAGIELAKGWFKEMAPEEVAYLGFTKAAAKEALYRILDEEISDKRMKEQAPYFRTIHSLAYMGLRKANPDVRVLTTSDMKRFSKETGLDGSFSVHEWEDLAEVFQSLKNRGRTEYDNALTAYALSRVDARCPDDIARARKSPSRLAQRTVGYLEDHLYEMVVRRYEAFKRKEGLVDFTDMLEFALCSMAPLDGIRKVVIDECQDLSPIHFSILDRIFSNTAEEIWWLGDDDQTVYGFCGANANLFLDRAQRAKSQIQLRQTYRFGQELVDFSKKIIQRVERRKEKEVYGLPQSECLIRSRGEFRPTTGNMLILHRHVQGCQALAAAFMDAGLPFSNERGKDPLSAGNRIKGWTALHELAQGKKARWGIMKILLEDLVPTRWDKGDGTKTRLLVHGAKVRLQEQKAERVDLDDLLRLKIVTPDGFRVLRNRDYGVMKHREDLAYYDRVVQNGHTLDASGTPAITTIHGAKGRQAPHVVVMSETGRRCWDDRDSEHRLAYVAATRAQVQLEVCHERTVEWATVAYPYPNPDEVARHA